MMINKRLISMMGDSKRYIAWNVVLQFLALLANIVMIFAVSLFLTGLVRREPDLPTALLYILGALIVRFFCTRRGVGQLQRQLHRQKNAACRHL